MGMRAYRQASTLKRAIVAFIADDMTTYAAALAYHALFASFPFMIFLVALLGLLRIPNFFDWLLEQARYVVPPQAFDEVASTITTIRSEQQVDLLSLGVLIAIWSASVGTRSAMHALNIAYNVTEMRPAWKRYPLSIIFTIGFAGLLILAVALMVVGPTIVEWLARQVGLDRAIVAVWTWARFPLAIGLVMVTLAIAYSVLPNRPQRPRLLAPGAVVAATGWVAASLGFSLHVSNIADYSITYGSLGASVVLLLYLYISGAVFLFGAEVNAAIEQHPREEAR